MNRIELITPWNTSEEEKRFLGICLEYFGPSGRREEKLFELLNSGVDEEWFFDQKNRSLFLGLFNSSLLIGQEDVVVTKKAIIDFAESNYGEIGWAAKRARECLDAVAVLKYNEYLEEEIPLWWNKIKQPKLNQRLGRLIENLGDYKPTKDSIEEVERLLEDALSSWRELPNQSEKKESFLSKIRDRILAPRLENTTVPTGLGFLDYVLGGGFAGEGSLEEGKLIVLMGRPGSGKTLFALTLAMRVASNGNKSAIWSFEMRKEQVGLRIIAGYDFDTQKAKGIRGSLPLTYDRLRTQNLDNELRSRLESHIYSGLEENIFVYTGEARSADSIIKQMKMISKKYPEVRLFIIDHLGLIDSDSGADDVNSIGKITKSLKLAAVALGVDILLLCQLNRSVEMRPDKRPQMSDARGSGRIEEDADVILGLYRESYYDQTADQNVMEAIALKNRQGAIGSFQVGVNLECCIAYDM